MKKRKHHIVLYAVCIILCIVIQILITRTGHRADERLTIGMVVIPFTSLAGVFQSMATFVCVFLASREPRKGPWISVGIMCVYLLLNVMSMLRAHTYAPLPGAISIIIFIIMIDIIVKSLRKIDRDAITDRNTKLLNRRGLLRKVEECPMFDEKITILLCRIKNLKHIVDNYGYEYGDVILKKIGDRISAFVGKDGIVSKFDGREFAVALGIDSDREKYAQKLSEIISEKLVIDVNGFDVEVYLPCFIGIATSESDDYDIGNVIRNAGIASYQANKDNMNICVYDANIEKHLHRNFELELIIRNALENDYFYLVFQPQFTTSEKKLRGFETLLRLKLPDGTFISPGEFIPVAEKSSLIMDIDAYVLRKAMETFADKIKNSDSHFVLSINVSAKNMASEDFTERIGRLLEETGFPADSLEIEITEYSFAQSQEITAMNVKELRRMGIMIALDDFGTGYTSMSQVLNLPVNLLKIDKSLIDNIAESQTNRDFVDSIIYMGHLMNCEVISEGVELQDQLNILNEHKCDFIQGYIWGKPISYDEAVGLVS